MRLVDILFDLFKAFPPPPLFHSVWWETGILWESSWCGEQLQECLHQPGGDGALTAAKVWQPWGVVVTATVWGVLWAKGAGGFECSWQKHLELSEGTVHQ